MPLKKGGTTVKQIERNVSANIRSEIASGTSREQAIAIALSTKRAALRKMRARKGK
jgi:hypothetical protein